LAYPSLLYQTSSYRCCVPKMAQTGILALALLGALALAGLPLVAQGAAYPLCPNSGKPPQPTRVPHTRCLSANEFSCCQDCQDLR